MASQLQLVLVILLVAGVASGRVDEDAGFDKDLQAVLNHARKLMGVRKQLAYDTGDSFPADSTRPGAYPASPEYFASPPVATTTTPGDRSTASLTESSTTSGSQSAATSTKADGGRDKSGSTAAAVIGSMLALVVIGILSVFAYKQWKGNNNNRQRYSTYSTFDNEMGQIRY